MLKHFDRKLNNKGAALVLVIVCLLFVGIIAAGILSLTMGNIDSSDTTGKGNDNFYDTEQLVDDLKIYLQKFASDAATKAYAKQLNNLSVTGTIDEAVFNADFYSELNKSFDVASGGIDLSTVAVSAIAKELADVSGITMNLGTYNPVTHKLEGVVITFKDNSVNDGYATTIYTDIEFSAVMPDLSTKASSGVFEYDIDKYVLIGKNDIYLNGIFGSITGNVYANGDLGVTVTAGKTLNMNSDFAVVGNEFLINVKKVKEVDSELSTETNEVKVDTYKYSSYGNFNYNGIGDDYKRVDPNATTYASAITFDAPANVSDIWANNIVVNGKVTTNNMHIYVGDDVSINGPGSEFTTNGGTLYAYSTVENISSTTGVEHENSGAIIINGKGSKVDLSSLDKLVLAGNAFTEVPSLALGLKGNKKYFVQGESITYKSLQTAYLVDGNLLYYGDTVVGRNPMTAAQYTAWVEGGSHCSSYPSGVTGITCKSVKYVSGGAEYWYAYWNFPTATAAINYGVSKKSELEAKINALNGGIVLLPEDGHYASKGTLITYDENGVFDTVPATGITGEATNISNCIMNYGKLMTGLSKEASIGTESLVTRIFGKTASLREIAKGYVETSGEYCGKLTKPSGRVITGGTPENITWDYYLITANKVYIGAANEKGTYTETVMIKDPETGVETPNVVEKTYVKFNPNSSDRYIVICDGDVEFLSPISGFKGMIIAGGNIVSNNFNHSLSCFGNVVAGSKYKSEFDALIEGLDPTESADKALMTILGISGGAAGTAGDDSKNDVGVSTVNYKKN